MQKDIWLKKLDYFFVTRPMLFFPGWNTLLAGYLSAKGNVLLFNDIFQGHWGFVTISKDLVGALLTFMLAMGGCFILNQLQDIDSDQRNKKLFFIGGKYIKEKNAYWESLLLLAFSLISGLSVNISIFLLIVVFIIITAYLYNYQPFRFKNRPLWGLVANMLMGWIAFAVGWSVSRSMTFSFLTASFPYLALNTSLYLLTTIPDAEGDMAAGKRTFCVRYGFTFTVWMAIFFYLLSLGYSGWGNDQLIWLLNLFIFYFFLRLALSASRAQVIRTIKMSIFFFSALIAAKFPWYVIIMIVIFFFTRYYYRQRFNFSYPNFRGE